jgi:RimJ/RimL family protein N-acetyltransferase
MQSRRTHGFGHLAVTLREPVGELPPGGFIGTAGAAMLPFGAWNLRYRFLPEAWGRGLGGEAGAASIEAARAADTTHLERLVFADRPLDDEMLGAVIALG